MSDYICKIASLSEIQSRMDQLISEHKNKEFWIKAKENALDGAKKANKIVYIGLLDGKIISEATAYLDLEAFKGDLQHPDSLVNKQMAYLCAFRTDLPYRKKGYFTQLYQFMESDLKQKGYRFLSLGVEKKDKTNRDFYVKLGFTDYLKTTIEYLPDEVTVDFYCKQLY